MSALHQHAKDVFLEALARPAGEREAFVAQVCGTDRALRQEVESLLAFHSEHQSSDAPPSSDGPMPVTPGREPGGMPFAAGEVFAGRYRMITRIGRGGMGDVWRADDLVLETPVALKLIQSSSEDARHRILNEVRLARQITDPAVCRVFDVGEADGRVFFSMELVPGEDLASLLRRVGRLPSEKVIEIAHQLCAGLAAAHAQGVLHRDLKPANILIDDSGRVRITDFGIAVTRGQPLRHTLTGTPGYMAPEQLNPGVSLSERTDIYALGLVLYELVVGQHPFNRADAPKEIPRPSARVPDVDRRLERVILHALAVNPDERPASAVAMASSLMSASAARSRRQNWPWLAGAAALFGLLAVGASFVLPSGGRPGLSEQDTIVLADFANTTGDPVFDGTLKVALAVALEQSPFLKVFPDERMAETLRMMGRPPTDPVTRSIAREVAQREQVKALLSGSISSLGRNYVLALEAVSASNGDVMAREQVEATSKEEVLTALGDAASRLREKLGESLASIEKFGAPLARATTPSIEALHAYSMALDQGTANPRLRAIPHLERALELDPNFALALAFTATVYANNGQTGSAAGFARRAFELRERVSERERYFIEFRYYRDAMQDWQRALDVARSWTATYPREAFAFNSLGTGLSRFGQHEEAVEKFREAVRLDPRFAASYSNLVSSLVALNQIDEAKRVIEDATAKRIEVNGFRRLSYVIAFSENDAAGMARALDATARPRSATELAWEGHTSAFGGRLAAAHELFRRGIQMALDGGFRESASAMAAEDAETHAVVGQCAEARAEANGAVAILQDNFALERASRALALCGAEAELQKLAQDMTTRFPEATLTLRVSLPIANAALAVHRQDARRALDILEPVRPYDRAPRAEQWPFYLRGLAHLQLKDGTAAAAQFQNILDHRGDDLDSQLYPLAHLGLARAKAMAGDTPAARTAYEAFFGFWESADPALTLARDARQEYARLR